MELRWACPCGLPPDTEKQRYDQHECAQDDEKLLFCITELGNDEFWNKISGVSPAAPVLLRPPFNSTSKGSCWLRRTRPSMLLLVRWAEDNLVGRVCMTS